MLNGYPYNVSDYYEQLYNYLVKFTGFFIIALSKHSEIYYKMFKMRKNNFGDITIADDMNYRTHISSKKEFIKICQELKIYWIVPSALELKGEQK